MHSARRASRNRGRVESEPSWRVAIGIQCNHDSVVSQKQSRNLRLAEPSRVVKWSLSSLVCRCWTRALRQQ